MKTQYSLLVKITKRTLAILITTILFGVLIWPMLVKNKDRVKLSNINKHSPKVTSTNEIINPNLHGHDKNGRPYIITAKKGFKTKDEVIKLSHITGKLRIEGEHKFYFLSASQGESKQNSELIYLYGDVTLANQDGYKATSQEVVINFKNSTAYSNTPIHIEGKDLILDATSFEMPSSGILIFKTNVKVRIK